MGSEHSSQVQSSAVNRSVYCGEVSVDSVGQRIILAGWVHRRRDHGGVIFLDLRDLSGFVQVVVSPTAHQAFALAEESRSEYVLRIEGEVRRRPHGTENADLETGQLEVAAEHIQILNASETLPFPLDEHGISVSEELRLKFRYLDLRRREMTERLILRHQINQLIRNHLNEQRFLEIETPYLTKATPEGARDYLVPSRTHPGAFFALPQSPQQFKQLLMVSGFDRYYQIVRCFRDEDLRADRQPEFTQLDLEMSFTDELTIQTLMEGLMVELFKKLKNIELKTPFLRMPYDQAMNTYGSDKPDLRNPLVLTELTDLMGQVDFAVFKNAVLQKGRVAALKVPGGAALSRKQIDAYTQFVGQFGAKGLAYIKINDAADLEQGLQSPIIKFLPHSVRAEILSRTGALTGDLLFFGAADVHTVNASLGALRQKIGHDQGLIREDDVSFLWVVNFPMFEQDDKSGRFQAVHHPFTAPLVDGVEDLKSRDPAQISARAYDLVLNGYEMGGGSIRIHSSALQQAVFETLGLSESTIQEKFGHLLQAFSYGCPPHGGIALGLDRIAMLMSGASSIRDVIAFPKTQSASCLLMGAPSNAEEAQLKELGIILPPLKTELALDVKSEEA